MRGSVGMAITVVSKGSINLEQGSSSQRSCSPSLGGIEALQKPSRLERVSIKQMALPRVLTRIHCVV